MYLETVHDIVSFTNIWVDVQELVVLPGVIQVGLPGHGYVGQVLLYGKEIPTPVQITHNNKNVVYSYNKQYKCVCTV